MPDRDYPAEIVAAIQAADVTKLGRIAMELHGRLAADDERRARQAAKKRRQRGETRENVPGQGGTSGDIGGQEGTGRDSRDTPLVSLSSPTPLLNPSLPPSAPTATERGETAKPSADAIEHYAIGLCTAANRAITARWGEQTNPIRWSAGHSIALAEALGKNGVPLELARSTISAVIRKAKQRAPFTNLSYFEKPIFEAHDSAKQRQFDRQSSTAAPSQREMDEQRRKQQEQLQGEYNRERSAALTRWRLDPKNEAEVERIQREANSRFTATSKSNDFEVRADRNRFTIAEESAAADFPPFDTWLSQRAQSPPAIAGTQ